MKSAVAIVVVATATVFLASLNGVAQAQTMTPAPCESCAVRNAAGPRLVRAAQTRLDDSGQVVFTVVSRPGEAYLSAEAPAVKFEKTSTDTGFVVRIQAEDDVVEFRATDIGLVEFSRRGKTKKFNTRQLKPDHIYAVQGLAVGSPALQAFDALAAVLEASDQPEAVSVLTTHAFVSALRGNPGAARALVRKLKGSSETKLRRVAQRTRDDGGGPASCYETWERTVIRYAVDLDYCIRDNWWNPITQAACSLEWAVKVELAWSWLIACSGGLPVR